MLNRRQFIQSCASVGALLGLPTPSQASSLSGRKFLFVILEGGWDPLCAFAPMFNATGVDMEAGAMPMSIGDFDLVDHAERPAVRSFFENWGASTLVVNGISTRSVSHEVCAEIALTGSSSGSASDWPTLIALAEQNKYPMPSLVFSGVDRAFAPTYPGDHEVVVVRTGESGQLQAMLEGYYLEDTHHYFDPFPQGANSILDDFVRKKSQTIKPHFTQRGSESLLSDFNQSLKQIDQLRALGESVDLAHTEQGGLNFNAALSALSMGLSRCVTLADGRDWDTHEDNSLQNPQFQELFGELDSLLTQMMLTPGTEGGSLLDETVVVVLSEMGRTPQYNATGGRDHWPYTSAMLIGNGIVGGRSVGAYNQNFAGVGFDPVTGDLMPDKMGVSASDFGATLLSLADIDPGAHLVGAIPFQGVLI